MRNCVCVCCILFLSSLHFTSLLSALLLLCRYFYFGEKVFFHDDSNLSIRWVSYKQYMLCGVRMSVCVRVCVLLKSHTIKMKITSVLCSILLECPDKNYKYTPTGGNRGDHEAKKINSTQSMLNGRLC